MKNIPFLFLLFATTLTTAQEYRYSYTLQAGEVVEDSAAYMVDIRDNNFIIGIGQGSPLVIPFDCITYDLKTRVNMSFGYWRVYWTDERMFVYERSTLVFILSDYRLNENYFKTKRT